MKPLQVACLTPYQPSVGASTRYRIGQYVPLLEQHGIQVRMVPFASPKLQRILYQPGRRLAKLAALVGSALRWLPQALQDTDVVFIQREAALLGPPLVERWLSHRYPVIYDFDDAIFLRQEVGVNGPLARKLRPLTKTSTLIGLSTMVFAGNEYLAEYARQYNSHVHVVPTTLDHVMIQPKDQQAHSKLLTLGWIGTNATTRYLELALPALEALAQVRPFRLLIVGADQPIEIAGVECINRRWNLEQETADLQEMDIGLYPLPESTWSLGKCALKAIQYGAIGIPTVCTPIGMNLEVIHDEVTGFYASTSAEWVRRLTQLIDDAALRTRLGATARQRIVQHYSLFKYDEIIAHYIRQAADGPQPQMSNI